MMLGVGRLVVPLPIKLCPCCSVMSMKHRKDKHKKRKGISKESEEVGLKMNQKRRVKIVSNDMVQS